MIRAAELMPLPSVGSATTFPARGAAAASDPASWFDMDGAEGTGLAAALSIGVALEEAARGLGVGGHAQRVLDHLCAAGR